MKREETVKELEKTVEELKKTRRSPLMRMWDEQRDPQRFPERRP